MRVRVTWVIVLLLSSLTVNGQDCMATGEWGVRGYPVDLELESHFLWVADGAGVGLFDVENPALPRKLSHTPTSAIALDVERAGNDLLLVLTTERLELYTISQHRLVLIESREATGTMLHLHGATAYVVGELIERFPFSSEGLGERQSTPLSVAAEATVLIGGHLYISAPQVGTAVWRLDGDPVEVGRIAASAVDLTAGEGSLLMMSRRHNGLTLVDIGAPADPRVISTVSGGIDAKRTVSHGSLVVVAGEDGRVTLIDLSNLGSPSIRGEMELAIDVMAFDGSLLYSYGGGADRFGLRTEPGVALHITDMTDPALPRVIATVEGQTGPISGVATNGRHLFVADPPWLRVVDSIGRPREIAQILVEEPFDRVRLEGTRLILYGRAWVHLLDVSSPEAPSLQGSWPTDGLQGGGASFAGPWLIEANRASGFHVLDVSDPSNIFQRGGLINDGFGQWLDVVGMPAVVYGLVTKGVKVVDVQDPDAPTVMSEIPFGSPRDVELATVAGSQYLLVLDGSLLRVHAISNPFQPMQIASVAVPDGRELSVVGSVVWLRTTGGEAVRIDLSDPTRPTVVGRIGPFRDPRAIAAGGEMAAVADRWSVVILPDPLSLTARLGQPPVMALSDESSGDAIRLIWSRPFPGTSEIETASTPDFTSATRIAAPGVELVRLRDAEERWVRVRNRDGCGVSPWSAPLRIGPRPEIRFMTGDVLVPVRGEPFAVPLVIRRDSGNVIEVELESSSAGVTVPSTVRLEEESTSFEAMVDSSAISGASDVTVVLRRGGEERDRTTLRLRPLHVIEQPSFVETGSLVLPGIGSTAGAAGTRWKSEATLFCEDGPCSIVVIYRAFGGGTRSVSLELDDQSILTLRDPVSQWFGLPDTAGYLEIRSHSGSVSARAWTFNDADFGRYVQSIDAVRVSSDVMIDRVIEGVESSGASRSNLGWINLDAQDRAFHLEIVDGTGFPVAIHDLLVPASDARQVPITTLVSTGTLRNGSVRVRGSSRLLVYASRIDQRTGDPAFLTANARAADDAGAARTLILDPVGATAGAEGSFWKTELRLRNGPAAQELELTFRPSSDRRAALVETLHLAGSESIHFEDVLSEIFPGLTSEQAVDGTLRIGGGETFTASARIYNEGPKGVFGQLVPVELASRGVRNGTLTLEPLEQTAARRTNLGLVETVGLPVDLTLRVRDATGRILWQEQQAMEGFGVLRLPLYLRSLSLDGLSDLRLEILVRGEGRVLGWASVVESGSGDARYLRAR